MSRTIGFGPSPENLEAAPTCKTVSMDVRDLIDQLQLHGRRLGEVIDGADPDTPVPSCPDWALRDLVRHIGGVHRWAATYVLEARLNQIDQDLDELVVGWPADAGLVDWYRAGHESLVAALRAAPEDLDCWTFLDAPSPLAMWSRRQAHETAIHRVDAELAVGARTGFDPDFATDGIDELLTLFITRPGRGPRSEQPRVVEFKAIDTAQSWWVSFDDRACVASRTPIDSATQISGSGADLYQAVWNRLPYESVVLNGDLSVVDALVGTMHVRWS